MATGATSAPTTRGFPRVPSPEFVSTETEPPAGWVFIGYIEEYGEEREASYRCRRCSKEAR
jgi:hypothetical protein